MCGKFKFWKIKKRDGVQFLSFEEWEGVGVFYSTRIGGVSPAPFDSMNLHYGRGDSLENVGENRKRLYSVMNIDEKSIVYTRQIHSDIVNTISCSAKKQEGDGLITERNDIYLGIFTADCPALFIYAPEKKIVGLVHSGWRGTMKNIAGEAIRSICETYSVEKHSIEVLFSPSIGPCCYKVGEEFLENFSEKYFRRDGYSLYFDLWSRLKDQLLETGIEKIHIPEICSCCNEEYFFSFRRSGDKVGENIGIIGIQF